MGTSKLDKSRHFLSTFSAQTVCNIHFWIWKYSKFVFICSRLWSILICKIPQFSAKSYRFGQFTILFWNVDTLRLLKIYITFCSPARAKYSFFLASSSWTILVSTVSLFLFCSLLTWRWHQVTVRFLMITRQNRYK